MIKKSWIRLYASCFDGVSIAKHGTWPSSIADLVSRYREEPGSDTLLIPATEEAATSAAEAAFQSHHGFAPERELIPAYEPGNEDDHPFYFLGVGNRDISVKFDENYAGQRECGNQIPEPLLNAGMGCSNGKVQIKNFTL